MRIADVTDSFVSLEKRSGCYMRSEYDPTTKTQTLRNTFGDNAPIAEIYDIVDKNNYRLRLHPKQQRYVGKTSHNNRLYQVLRSIQHPQGNTDWELFRYSTHVQYTIKVYDRKLNISYNLEDRPLEFQFTDGRLTIDYQQLERGANPTQPAPVAVELDANDNLTSVDNKLTAILAGV